MWRVVIVCLPWLSRLFMQSPMWRWRCHPSIQHTRDSPLSQHSPNTDSHSFTREGLKILRVFYCLYFLYFMHRFLQATPYLLFLPVVVAGDLLQSSYIRHICSVITLVAVWPCVCWGMLQNCLLSNLHLDTALPPAPGFQELQPSFCARFLWRLLHTVTMTHLLLNTANTDIHQSTSHGRSSYSFNVLNVKDVQAAGLWHFNIKMRFSSFLMLG